MMVSSRSMSFLKLRRHLSQLLSDVQLTRANLPEFIALFIRQNTTASFIRIPVIHIPAADFQYDSVHSANVVRVPNTAAQLIVEFLAGE